MANKTPVLLLRVPRKRAGQRLDTRAATVVISSPRRGKKVKDAEVPCLPTEITEAAISARFRKNVYLWRRRTRFRADTE